MSDPVDQTMRAVIGIEELLGLPVSHQDRAQLRRDLEEIQNRKEDGSPISSSGGGEPNHSR